MFLFDSQLIKTDVTAVKIEKNFLLIGVGGCLQVFDKVCYKLINKINVFEGQNIYGISLNKHDNKILLYGGRYIKILDVNQSFTELNELLNRITFDWVLNAKWIDDGRKIASVSMHNKLHIWNQDLVLLSNKECEEKCILYSAIICNEKFDELIILSGTVFSEVLIWRPTRRKNSDCVVLKRLQMHHGVIFSIHYNETSGYICSSSDDRSAILWKIKKKNLLLELQQDNVEIYPVCTVHGHLSRIFRCQILSNCFITAGEDSFLNIWSFDGILIRRIETHQGGPIWAFDFDEKNNLILTGGGDCGVTCFPIYSNFKEEMLMVPNDDKPKIVGILASKNLIVFTENGLLLYFVTKTEKWLKIQDHEDLKSYALLEISSCRSLIALADPNQNADPISETYCTCKMAARTLVMCAHAISSVWNLRYAGYEENVKMFGRIVDLEIWNMSSGLTKKIYWNPGSHYVWMPCPLVLITVLIFKKRKSQGEYHNLVQEMHLGFHGQIYIYKEEHDTLQKISFFETKSKSRIFSLHWLNCQSFSICQTEGIIILFYLKNYDIIPISKFILPVCKERWTTCALFVNDNNLVVGDRKGNLHLYKFGKEEAIQSLKKVHTYLGVTNILIGNEKITSLGRNGIIKTFSLNNKTLQLISSDKLPFTWLVNIIEGLLLAFSGNNFVIWNHKTKRIIFEKSCGGGHRSWDLFKNMNNTITFSYIKNKIINKIEFQLNDFLPVDVIEGYQVKEINSLRIINIFDSYIIISGGEDTTLRINLLNPNNFENLVMLKSHLSSIRSIVIHQICNNGEVNKPSYLVFSAGGRAQIVCWKLQVFTENNSFKNVECSEQYSYYKIIDCEESEIRIMDLAVTTVKNNLLLFCACSDGTIKIFFVESDNTGRYRLIYYHDLFYKLKCITKLCNIDIFSHNILVTMAMDGKLIFWDVTNIVQNIEVKPFHSTQAHQSGINSKAFKILKDNLCLFLTGGDDNAVVLNLFQFKISVGVVSIENIDFFTDISTHCAQITGVFIADEYFITISIDQRVCLFDWKIYNNKVICTYLTKYNTSVADLQGLECFETSTFETFIYGKGLEYIRIKKAT